MPKRVPFEFVLDELAPLQPRVRAMFGAHAIYVGDAMMFIVREKGDADDGVWLATAREHHASLLRELPSLRSIELLGGNPTAWQNIPASAPGFEREAMAACALVLRGDARIGKRPRPKKAKAGSPKKRAAQPPIAKPRKLPTRAEAAAFLKTLQPKPPRR